MKLQKILMSFCLGFALTATGFAKQSLVIDSKTKIYHLTGPWEIADTIKDYPKERKPVNWRKVDNRSQSIIRKAAKRNNDIWYRIPLTITDKAYYCILFQNYYPGITFYFNGKKIHEKKVFYENNQFPEKIRHTEIIPVQNNSILTGRDNLLMIKTVAQNDLNRLQNNIFFMYNEKVKDKWLYPFLWDVAFIIICFFLFLYFFIFYITRKTENYYLYYSVLALFLSLWTLSYKGIILWLINNLTVFLLLKYFGSIFCVYFSILFIIAFLQLKRGLDFTAFKVIYLCFGLFIAAEIISTGRLVNFKTYLHTPYMITSLLAVIYGQFLCVQGIIHKKNYAKILFSGITIFSIFIVIMILGYFSIVPDNSYILEGFFLFTISIAVALASRYTKVYSRLEKINEDLQNLDRQKDFILSKLNMYEHIVSASRDHMAFINTDLQLMAVNNSLVEALGTNRVYVLNKSIHSVYGENDFTKKLNTHCAICLSGHESFFEKEFIFQKIGKRYLATTLIPYYEKNSSDISGIVLNSRDITERVLFETKIVNLALEERRKIGMELHDNISQILAGVKLKLSVLSDNLQKDCPAYTEKSTAIEKQIEESINATRNIAKGLFPVTLEHDNLAYYKDDFFLLVKKHNITIELTIDESIALGDVIITMHLYYIIVESINNVIKHSKATRLVISFYKEKNRIYLSIKDNGIGFKIDLVKNKGIGLTILKYRARMIGSTLNIENPPEGGTNIQCILKL